MTTGAAWRPFAAVNHHAPVYIHQDAFRAYYALEEGRDPRYIGLPQGLQAFRDRFILTAGETVIDDELTLFTGAPGGV